MTNAFHHLAGTYYRIETGHVFRDCPECGGEGYAYRLAGPTREVRERCDAPGCDRGEVELGVDELLAELVKLLPTAALLLENATPGDVLSIVSKALEAA